LKTIVLALVLLLVARCAGQPCSQSRQTAQYYAAAYARHYGLPVEFVRAVIEQESGWRPCAVSVKGAVGLMQLMPSTAARPGS
jgi:soluble lytic murein transglycosylase-like protein